MVIEVKCPSCHQTFKVAASEVGQRGSCPYCDTFVILAEKHFAQKAPQSARLPRGWRPGTVFPYSTGHEGSVNSLAWCLGGTLVVSAGDDGTVRLWQVDTGNEIRCIKAHEGAACSAAFRLDGECIISGGEDCRVRVWARTSGKCLRTFEGHTGPVQAAAFWPPGRYAISAGKDKTIRIWDLATGKCVKARKNRGAVLTAIACDPEGEFLLSAAYDRAVRIWRAGRWRRGGKLTGHGGPVLCLGINANGGFAISGSADRTVAVWDTLKQEAVRVLKGHMAPVHSVSLSGDAALAATGGADWFLRIWDVDAAECKYAIESVEQQCVSAVAFEPEGTLVAAADASGHIRLYDAGTGRLIRIFGGAEGTVTVLCPGCRRKLHLAPEFIGFEGLCPFCKRAFKATAWSPRESETALRLALQAVHEGQLHQAIDGFDQAIRLQCDNHGACLKAITARLRLANDLAASDDFGDAIEILQQALGVFEKARPWPAEFLPQASKAAYEVAFLAGKLCRFKLSDAERAKSFCSLARTFCDTPEVEDMLLHITDGTPPPVS